MSSLHTGLYALFGALAYFCIIAGAVDLKNLDAPGGLLRLN